MLRHCRCSRWIALGCVALAGSLLAPGRAAADPVAKPPTVLETARVVAARHAGALTAARASQAQAAQPDLESGSFFKSPAGIAVIAVFAAGLGYAFYSASNDRIKSAGR